MRFGFQGPAGAQGSVDRRGGSEVVATTLRVAISWGRRLRRRSPRTGAREPQFQARGEGRPVLSSTGSAPCLVGAMPGRRHRRSGRRGLAPESPLASKGPLDSSWDPERSREASTSSFDDVIRDLSRMELERVFPAPVSTGRASVLWRSARWLFWAAAWGHRSNTRTGSPS